VLCRRSEATGQVAPGFQGRCRGTVNDVEQCKGPSTGRARWFFRSHQCSPCDIPNGDNVRMFGLGIIVSFLA
jgi:hypothetical protein